MRLQAENTFRYATYERTSTIALMWILPSPADDLVAGGRRPRGVWRNRIVGSGEEAPENADGISPERAVGWREAMSATWRAAEVPAEKADLLHAIYERIVVTGRTIVSIRLTPSAYAHGLAVASPTKVAVARPTGVGRALATYDIPIEGRDEWLAAARRLA